jgi:hypothetical protein
VRRDIITLYTHDAGTISSIADDGLLQHEEETQRQFGRHWPHTAKFYGKGRGKFFPLFATGKTHRSTVAHCEYQLSHCRFWLRDWDQQLDEQLFNYFYSLTTGNSLSHSV